VLTILLGNTRGAPGSLNKPISFDQRIIELDDSRQAPDVLPLTWKVVGKGDGDGEGSNVSRGRIDREAVGSTTRFGLIATAAHVTGGIVGVLDGTGDQIIAALGM
jgi:hypothetical protein